MLTDNAPASLADLQADFNSEAGDEVDFRGALSSIEANGHNLNQWAPKKGQISKRKITQKEKPSLVGVFLFVSMFCLLPYLCLFLP